jgi:hypothetical protein
MSGGSIIPRTQDWPSVFFAFKHNETLLRLTDAMRDDLRLRRVLAYRLVDHPMPGTNLRLRAEQAIAGTDGMVLFWSQQAAESEWVRHEYSHAKDVARKPVCLILFPGVARPSDWHPDIEWMPLQGVTFPTQASSRLPVPLTLQIWRTDFAKMMRKVEIFARAAKNREIEPP